jgi:DdrB-like protein
MPESNQSESQSSNGYIEKLITTLGQRLKTHNEIMQAISNSLDEIESHLRQIAISNNPAPNYQRQLSEYPTFDWTSINATVLGEDGDGATTVEWAGQVFTRRSPSNRYGEAIWFSRCVGKDLDGNNKYVRLITFKAPAEASPIPEKARKGAHADGRIGDGNRNSPIGGGK